MSTRIKDLTEDTTPAGADSVPIDHATDGVRRTLLSSIAALFATLLGGVGLESDGGSPAKLRVKSQLRALEGCRWQKDTTDGAGTTATVEREFYRNNTGAAITLSAVHLSLNGTLAGNDTNNFTIVIRTRDGAGGGASTVVSFTNNVAGGGITALVTKSLGALTTTALPDGHILTTEITKTAAGQVVGVGAVEVLGSIAG